MFQTQNSGNDHFLFLFNYFGKYLLIISYLLYFFFNSQGKKIKNIRRDAFGSKLGRVHMTSQDVGKLQTRKMKGLKKTPLKPKENKKKGKRRNKNKNDNKK